MELESKPYRILQIPVDNFEIDPDGWFCKQNTGEKTWLLVHADDGIIWGEIRDGRLITAREFFGEKAAPPLRVQTIQQARLFGPEAEVRVWRNENSFQACRIEDEPGRMKESFDEAHLLWGTKYLERCDGFTLVAEGSRGFVHCVPLFVPDDAFGSETSETSGRRRSRHPLRLGVRHYIEYDQDGMAYISLSRLTGIWYEKNGG